MTFDIGDFAVDGKENEARKLYRKKLVNNCLIKLLGLFISIAIASTVIQGIYKRDIEPNLKKTNIKSHKQEIIQLLSE